MIPLALLEYLPAAAAIVLSLYVALLIAPDLYLLTVHWRRRRPPRRAGGSARRRPPEEAWTPSVCVQLAAHDEPTQIEGAIDALCALDWPRDKLEIMVLDDSTDRTTALAEARIADWQARGVKIRLLHRSHRAAFKAGALAAGLAHTDAPVIAVFDVDYRPPADFLRRLVPLLGRRADLAFVQARLDHRNRDANLLTRAQALELDMYFAYEQAARSWAGIPTPFNGTCGVWRREAIMQAGGWSGQTLVEDQDLSLRAFARGWRSAHTIEVSAAGLLPEQPSALAAQRQRWATGVGQAFQGLPWSLLRHLDRWQALIFLLVVQFHAALMPVLVAALVAIAVCWLFGLPGTIAATLALGGALALVVLLKSAGAAFAYRAIGRRLGWRFLVDLGAMWLMEAWLLPILGKALIEGHLRRDRPFVRTPKPDADQASSTPAKDGEDEARRGKQAPEANTASPRGTNDGG